MQANNTNSSVFRDEALPFIIYDQENRSNNPYFLNEKVLILTFDI